MTEPAMEALDRQAIPTETVCQFLESRGLDRNDIDGKTEKFDTAIIEYSSNSDPKRSAMTASTEFDIVGHYPHSRFHSRMGDRVERCICTQKLRRWFLVQNRENGTILRIGHECSEKIGPDESISGSFIVSDESEDVDSDDDDSEESAVESEEESDSVVTEDGESDESQNGESSEVTVKRPPAPPRSPRFPRSPRSARSPRFPRSPRSARSRREASLPRRPPRKKPVIPPLDPTRPKREVTPPALPAFTQIDVERGYIIETNNKRQRIIIL